MQTSRHLVKMLGLTQGCHVLRQGPMPKVYILDPLGLLRRRHVVLEPCGFRVDGRVQLPTVPFLHRTPLLAVHRKHGLCSIPHPLHESRHPTVICMY